MRPLYSILFYVALPVIYLRLWWKGQKNPLYRKGWQERLGVSSTLLTGKSVIWVHAVSVGEMIAARPLIQQLQANYPDHQIMITNMTPTGLALAKQIQGNNIHCSYVPYDVPFAIEKFLNRIQPKLIIIMETELWPNLIHIAANRKIPIIIANARLSEKSFQSYKRIKKMTHSMLKRLSLILAQTQSEAERFITLGANPDQLKVSGNIKFDVPVPEDQVLAGKILRSSWGKRPVWIAASTHAGEESQILEAFNRIRQILPETLLVLVPRHQERFSEVASLCIHQGFNLVRRTQNSLCDAETQIFLGDTLGELYLYYATADVAFVGGSLIPVGGHNPLEPAALGLPIVSGNQWFNFRAIYELLKTHQAVIEVNHSASLAKEVLLLLRDKITSQQMGKRAQQVVFENRGALASQMEAIKIFL